MANIQPATIAARIDGQINERMIRMTCFVEPNDFQLLRWEDEIRKLQQVEPSDAFIMRALIAHMRGDVPSMEQHFQAAEYLHHSATNIGMARLCTYSNLGFATKALEYFRKYVDIKNGNLGVAAISGCGIGAFQRVSEIMDQAKAANLELPHVSQMTQMGDAAAVLKRMGITDELCAKVVDVAGEVLRSRNLFWQDLSPKVTLNEEDGTVAMRMRVDATAQQASEMTMETADKLIDQDLDALPFYVHFLGSRA